MLFHKLDEKLQELEAGNAELRNAEAALSEQEECLSAIVENIPIALFVKDAVDLRVVRLNRAGEDLIGSARDEAYGKTDRDLFAGGEADPFTDADRKVLAEGQILDIPRETVRTKNGRRVLHTRKIPIYDRGGKPRYLLRLSEDITERVAVEEALNRATRKLNLLNTVTFTEIQNAVYLLSEYLELGKEPADSEQREQYRQKQADVIQMLQDSLNYAKNYQSLGLKPPAWQSVMHTFLYAISHLDMSGISHDIRVDGLEIYADPLLERVFFALAENVVLHGKTATRISVHCRETDDGLVIVVEDDGAGIPADMKETIFERVCGKKPGRDLFLAREILSITGITIRETGSPGNGARFEMLVPKGGYRLHRA